jgi:hypothetical protein
MAKILVIEDMDSVVDLLRTRRTGWKRWKRFAAKSRISCCWI